MDALAEQKLRARLVEYEKRLEGIYVHRRLFRKGADPRSIESEEFVSSFTGKPLEKHQDALSDDELLSKGNILILGSAGSGKSFFVWKAFVQGCNEHIEDKSFPKPILIECRLHLGSQNTISDTIRQYYEGLNQDANQILIIDGLDEGVQSKGEGFLNDLGGFIDDNRRVIEKIILTCRKTFWKEDWFIRLGFRPELIEVFDSDYLEESKVYPQIIPDDSRRDSFYEEISNRGMAEFLNHPFEGFFLARKFQKGEKLPNTQFECFNLQIDECLKGSKREQAQLKLSTPKGKLRKYATLIAAVSVLGEGNTFQRSKITEILNSDESFDKNEIPELLNRPLFNCTNQSYSFSHQLYAEFLAAEFLSGQTLRKQRMLLSSESLGNLRIIPNLRGVAMFLSSFSTDFAKWLRENDPIVAFTGETTNLNPGIKETFLKAALDKFIREKVPPWQRIPPHGYRLDEFLDRYRPSDVARFLEPYLKTEEEFSLFWGLQAAVVWGGDSRLNPILIGLVKPAKYMFIPLTAIEAVEVTKDAESLRDLYPHLKSDNGRIKSRVLQIFLKLDKPSPEDYISRFKKFTPHPEYAAEAYGESVTKEDLPKAFQILLENYDDLRYVFGVFFRGLIERADELDYEDIPLQLFLNVWINDELPSIKKATVNFLEPRLEVKHRLCNFIFERPSEDTNGRLNAIHYHQIEKLLQQIACPEFLNWMPTGISSCSDRRYWFIGHVLLSIQNNNETTQETIELMKRKFPEQFPEPPKLPKKSAPRKPTAQQISKKIELTLKKNPPAMAVVDTLRKLIDPNTSTSQEVPAMIRIIDNLEPDLKGRILAVFRDFVDAYKYFGESEGKRSWRRPSSVCGLPFIILLANGQNFLPPKISEFLFCYAFYAQFDDIHKNLLGELRKSAPDIWEETVIEMIEDGGYRDGYVLSYLIEQNSDIYLDRCGNRLIDCSLLASLDLGKYLEYWKHFKAKLGPKYKEVLWQNYQCLKILCAGKKESVSSSITAPFSFTTQFAPFYMLLEEDDDKAWKELTERIQNEDVPIGGLHSSMEGLGFEAPNNPARALVLLDWYRLCMSRIAGRQDSMAGVLIRTILNIGDLKVLHKLRELHTLETYRNAKWEADFIMELEDKILSAKIPPKTQEILDLLLNNKFTVSTERGLFDVVCQAIEDLKMDYESGNEDTIPYWKDDKNEPRHETLCQPALWPRLKDKLTRLGVSNAEERKIGSNKVDFYVEKPLPGINQPLMVCVELKVAYGKKRLLDPIYDQLWKKYMKPKSCTHGLYIVLWFKCDSYRKPQGFHNPKELLSSLRGRCKEIGDQECVYIEPYVIDMTV